MPHSAAGPLAQPVAQPDIRLDPACALILLQDIAETALRVISPHGIQTAEPRAEGMDRAPAPVREKKAVLLFPFA